MTDELEALLDEARRGESDAVRRVPTLSAAARAHAELELAPSLVADEPMVRAVALRCVVALAGDRAVPALLDALGDTDAYVRSTAARELEPLAGAGLGHALLSRYERAESAAVRRLLAHLAGALGDPSIVEWLRALEQREHDPLAKRACTLALARLGVPDARRAVADALARSQGQERRAWLEDVGPLHGPWLLPALATVLDDDTPLVYVGAHAAEPDVVHLRAVDLAVNRIATLAHDLPGSFPIEARAIANYTPSELDAVRRWLQPRLHLDGATSGEQGP